MNKDFDYSKLDRNTAEKLQTHEQKIKENIAVLGKACWSAGKAMIGKDATKEQIANLLSSSWGHDKEILLHAMEWVDKNE